MKQNIDITIVLVISVALITSMAFIKYIDKPKQPSEEEKQAIYKELKAKIDKNLADIENKANSVIDDAPATNEEINDAKRLCSIVRETDRRVRCTVIPKTKTIKLTMDAYGIESQKICNGIVIQTAGVFSLKGWFINVFTPWDNDKTIAHCYPT